SEDSARRPSFDREGAMLEPPPGEEYPECSCGRPVALRKPSRRTSRGYPRWVAERLRDQGVVQQTPHRARPLDRLPTSHTRRNPKPLGVRKGWRLRRRAEPRSYTFRRPPVSRPGLYLGTLPTRTRNPDVFTGGPTRPGSGRRIFLSRLVWSRFPRG